jgi:uncharacterized RDD family membrane protein YckC
MRRPDNEPLLFDLPLDRPARDGDAEPVLDRQPPRAPRTQQPAKPQQTSPARSRASQASGGAAGEAAAAGAAAGRAAAGRAATAESSPPAPRLPLATAAAISPRLAPPAPAAPGATPEQAEGAERDLWSDRAVGDERGADGAVDAATATIPSDRAGIGRRVAAGAADLLVHVAVAVLALAGCRTLGVMPAVADWPAFGVFLLSFSFLYTVVPLAFWGHTLGMTWAGLTAESTGGEPLSFDQTARRWLGALLTLATAGLPLLLALRGRSLADRLSGSRTLAV